MLTEINPYPPVDPGAERPAFTQFDGYSAAGPTLRRMVFWLATLALSVMANAQEDGYLQFEGQIGAGRGKRIVLISGDEEYRSEEALPMMARILANRHGFTCTVLFAIGDDGFVDPNRRDRIPGLVHLAKADLMLIATRFRGLPPDSMRHIDTYLRSGKPVVGMRTATHAFELPHDSEFGYFSHDYAGEEYEGGFGRRVLGERWVNHHGEHGRQSTLGILVPTEREHPILRGIHDRDIWGPTDVYEVRLPLPGDSRPLVLGEVLSGMSRESPPVEGAKNDPRMPIAWTKTYTWQGGPSGRVFATTMGASQDLESVGLRRLIVNGCYWCVGLESAISADSDVRIVGSYQPTPFGFGAFQKGKRPNDF